MQPEHFCDPSNPLPFFMARLERFARLAAGLEGTDNPAFHKLAKKATLDAYRDLSRLGYEETARAIIQRASARQQRNQ